MNEDFVQSYLRAHAEAITAAEHARTFELFRPHLREGVVLDWGCFSGLDAQRIRAAYGPAVTLFGCDVQAPMFSSQWKAIGMEYLQLLHPWKLPYDDNYFDTVIGSGTLEHVPNESASLSELWRILKPHGVLVTAYLPLRYSAIELALRRLGQPHHKRRYTAAGIREKLLNHGFVPSLIRTHHSTPMRGPKFLRKLWKLSAPAIERSPFAPFTQNLMAVAVKQSGIGAEFFMKTEHFTVYGQSWGPKEND